MILVTGARGFVGHYCIRELSKQGIPLFITTSNKEACRKDNGYLFHYLNLEETDSFSVLPGRIDSVIHLAALIPKKNEVVPFSKFMNINAIGVKQLMETAAKKGCRRFIYASTQMVIDNPFYLPVDENHPLVPSSDYGLSKAIGERYCLSCSESLNINVISLRFAQIYGAGENPGFVLTNFIKRATIGLPLSVHGSGKVRRDLLYVKDAVKAILCALNSNTSGIFNIGSGRGVSIKELAETVSGVFSDRNTPVEFENNFDSEGEDFYLDTKKAQTKIGFVPQYTLKEGLKDYQSEMLRRDTCQNG